VIDLTSPGWIASPDNIAELSEKLDRIQCADSDTFVLDLHNNLAYKFEQSDGSMSLLYKSSGNST
jgi:hypothetical protein